MVSYIFNTSAVGGVWTNGTGISVYKKKTGGEVGLDEILTLPRYREKWSGSDSIPSKGELNAALDSVLAFDNTDNWATTTVGQLEAGIRIYIGPRWNSASIKVDNPTDISNLVPYLTANAALELRRFTVKWLDARKANPQQRQCIDMLKIHEGDILISRSGTIGKVTYATKDLAENYIVSDDLVRIRVKDANLRAYLLAYFTSSTALALMLLDEYGSVQQHLQPRHIQEMLIPVPDDWSLAQDMIDAGNMFIKAMEDMSKADRKIRMQGFDALIAEYLYNDQAKGDQP